MSSQLSFWALGLIISLSALGHRLPNLLSTSEAHLDEWGGNAKKDAEAFTYRILFYASILSFVLGYAFLNVDTPDLRLVFAPSFDQLGGTLILLAPLLKLITTNRLAWSIQSLSEEDALEMDEIGTRKDKGNGCLLSYFASFLRRFSEVVYWVKNMQVLQKMPLRIVPYQLRIHLQWHKSDLWEVANRSKFIAGVISKP